MFWNWLSFVGTFVGGGFDKDGVGDCNMWTYYKRASLKNGPCLRWGSLQSVTSWGVVAKGTFEAFKVIARGQMVIVIAGFCILTEALDARWYQSCWNHCCRNHWYNLWTGVDGVPWCKFVAVCKDMLQVWHVASLDTMQVGSCLKGHDASL